MSRKKIFISHITEEEELAAILKRHVNADFGDAIEVFMSSDTESIVAGDDWLKSINTALADACIELILCSTASIKRPWVNFEAGAGWIRSIPIVPVCHTGFRPPDLPMPLHIMQAVEINQERGLEQLYSSIAKRIGVPRPEVELSRLRNEVLSFEKEYAGRLEEMLKGETVRKKPPRKPQSQEERRLIGTWEGTGADIDVPGFKPLESKFSYRLDLKLQQKGGKVCGEFFAYIKERDRKDKAIIELIHISGNYFSFGYWLASANASHYGIMMLNMLGIGDEMNGFFLTKKVFEERIGFGSLHFTKK